MGKLLGVPMGCDVCYTNHCDADQNSADNLLLLLTAAGCNFFMGVPCADDVMLTISRRATTMWPVRPFRVDAGPGVRRLAGAPGHLPRRSPRQLERSRREGVVAQVRSPARGNSLTGEGSMANLPAGANESVQPMALDAIRARVRRPGS